MKREHAPAASHAGTTYFILTKRPSLNRIVILDNSTQLFCDDERDIYFNSPKIGAYIEITHTQMRAPYVSKDGFQFTIHHKGLFSNMSEQMGIAAGSGYKFGFELRAKRGKHLGLQDVEVGYLDFDREFILKSTDGAKFRALFANPRIRQVIQSHPDIHFWSKTMRGGSAHVYPGELYLSVLGVIEDAERLKSFFLLFTETLSQLCDIGSAYESDPRGAAMRERRRR